MISGAASFTGVHQTTPVGTFFQASGTDDAQSVPVTSVAANELVFDSLAVKGSQTATADPGPPAQDERWNANLSSDVRTAGSTEAGTGTVNMDWSLGSSVEWALGAVALKSASASAVLTDTLSDGAVDTEIVAGNEKLVITLTGDTWVAAGTPFNDQRAAIIQGLDAAVTVANGWNDEVRDKQGVGGVVRTNNTQVTITLDAQAAYNIAANETITVTVPASALVTSGSSITATPTFDITALEPFGYRRKITIDKANVGVSGTSATTLSDFPMLFSFTHDNLKTEAVDMTNGRIQKAAGWDILFRALDDDTCGGVGLAPCTLDHEIEKYVDTTGELIAWVRLPSVNADASTDPDTDIYIYYGNTAIQGSIEDADGVWDANYVAVWHLDESGNGSDNEFVDSSGVGNHGTGGGPVGSGDPTKTPSQDTSGQIANAQDFDGSDDYVNVPDTQSSSLTLNRDFTISAWVYPHSFTTADTIAGHGGSEYVFRIENSGELQFLESHISSILLADTVLTTNTSWYHAAVTVSPGSTATVTIFLNGVADGDTTTTRTLDDEGCPFFIGIDRSHNVGCTGAFSSFFDGTIDEVQISNAPRDADWIKTSYNNQVWPDKAVTPTPDPSPNPASGFYTVGTEEGSPLTAVELVAFQATAYDRAVLVEWRTGYEIDNLGFHVYREQAGERIQLTPALIAGSGLLAERGMAVRTELAYAWWDMEASRETRDIAYWLEDVDFDGVSTWHGPVTPVDGGHLIDVGPPAADEGVEGSNSRSLKGLGQVRVARRQRFLAGDEDEAVGFAGGPPPSLVAQWVLAGQPGVKIGIERAGWYRVSQPVLVAAGLDPSVHPRALRLVVDGVEQALQVTGSVDGRFDPGDAIEFYGEGVRPIPARGSTGSWPAPRRDSGCGWSVRAPLRV